MDQIQGFQSAPSKYEIVQAPPFASTPLFMRKVLVSPTLFFTKPCFMKPIVRYHEIIVFHQDLTTTGSYENMLVFFQFTT